MLTHTGHVESPNGVASSIDELDNTLPRFTGVEWDSVRATHGVSDEAYAWKTSLGRGRTQPGFLVLVVPRAHVCHVVRFRPLQG
jgi:hypothetical protein